MKKTRTAPGAQLTRMAAALGLALGAVAAMPAVADDAKTPPTQDSAMKGSGAAGADDMPQDGKAASPCAVKKKKKKKGPCAVGS